ncbi:unnamed protein product [Symbiodinium sp. KB8]|nr:unnamed protein product [Symbiodinium sp. KB8]
MDCRLFMDFDMAVLGRPWEQYEEYSRQIRREYSHVPEAVFCLARSAFLKSAAADLSSPIYATETFRDSRESQARANAAKEAQLLSEQFERNWEPGPRWLWVLLQRLPRVSWVSGSPWPLF